MDKKKKKDPNIYNLQVPIPTTLAEQLKVLAKADDRNLRTYCKKVLEAHVNGNDMSDIIREVQNLTVPTETSVTTDEIQVNSEHIKNIEKQKPKVGKLAKK